MWSRDDILLCRGAAVDADGRGEVIRARARVPVCWAVQISGGGEGDVATVEWGGGEDVHTLTVSLPWSGLLAGEEVRARVDGPSARVVGSVAPSCGEPALLSGSAADIYAALTAGRKVLLQDGEAVGDIVLPAGGASTYLTPWIDVTEFSYLAWWVTNTGAANPITYEATYFAPFADGMRAAANGNTVSIGPYATYMSQCGTYTAGMWHPSYTAPAAFRGFRVAAASASGTTARCSIVGMR